MNAPSQEDSSPLTASSPDLPGGTFPRAFTRDGSNRLRRLEWSTPPPGTQELAIEMLDPDAPGGTFTHWLVDGLPPGLTGLTAVPAGAAEGVNKLRPARLVGPLPAARCRAPLSPRGPCVDTRLGLAAGARRSDLESRASGHVLGKGELVGLDVAPCPRGHGGHS